MMPNDVHVTVGDRKISHRSPGPFAVELIGYGMAIVTNGQGINWTSGLDGATMFAPDEAVLVAVALNKKVVQ